MGKKKILGKTKLSAESVFLTKPSAPIKLARDKNKMYHPRSFRLRQIDLENLNNIVNNVNKISNTNIDSTKIIRALIKIGTSIKPEKILDTFKEIM